ncbi:MAG: M56 family metallopeptidase, partial [Planctomycetota bacterium]
KAGNKVYFASSTSPELVISDLVSGPLAAGLWRAKVVFPNRLLGRVTPAQTRDIFLHEVAHIVRRDQLIVLFQNLVAALFWLHPLVRLLNRQLAQSREEVCDNYVLQTIDSATYSRTLLALAEIIQIRRPLPGTVGLFTSRWCLEHRVAGLLDQHRNRDTRLTSWGRALVAAMFLSLTVGLSFGTVTPAIGQQTNVAGTRLDVAEAKATQSPTDNAGTSGNLQTTQSNIVKGKILNEKGEPLAGVLVVVIAPRQNNVQIVDELLAEGQTGSDGHYQLTLKNMSSATQRDLRLVARAEGQAVVWQSLNLKSAESTIDLTLRQQLSIQIRLTNDQGAPAANVAVDIAGLSTKNGAGLWTSDPIWKRLAIFPHLVSDATGLLTVPHTSRDQNVELQVNGTEQFAPQTLTIRTELPAKDLPKEVLTFGLAVPPGEVVTAQLAPARQFEGIITLGNSGQPAVAATVRIEVQVEASRQNTGRGAVPVEGQTDEHGRFRLNCYPGNTFTIKATPPAGTPFLTRELRNLKWDLPPVAATDKAPRKPTELEVTKRQTDLAHVEYTRSITANNAVPGTFPESEVNRLKLKLELAVLRRDRANEEYGIVTRSADGSKKIKIRLPEGISVQGTVVNAVSGTTLAGASIQYYPETATQMRLLAGTITGWQGLQLTNEQGQFQIVVPPGPGTLLVHAPIGTSYILQEKGRRELETGLPGGQRNYAHAFVKINPPVPDAAAAKAPSTNRIGLGRIDSDNNRIEFGRTDPNVGLKKPLTIKLQPGGTVTAKIVDAFGKPIERANLYSRLDIRPTHPVWRATLDEATAGQAEFRGLEKGQHYPVFVIDFQQHLGATATISLDDPQPTIRLLPCTSAKARFVTTDGKPVSHFFLDLHMMVTPGKAKYDTVTNPEMLAADEDSTSFHKRTMIPSDDTLNDTGEFVFLNLIPGATYRFLNNIGDGQQVAEKEFVAESGKTHDLGQITVQSDDILSDALRADD